MAENKKKNKKKSKPPVVNKASSKSTSGNAKKKKLTAAQRRELERQNRITQLLMIVGSLIVTFIVVIIFVVIMQGDNNTNVDYTATGSSADSDALPSNVYPASSDYKKAPDGEQLKAPSKGEEVAVLETSMGNIKIRLFPEYVPTAVENFKNLIKSGYYDGITFHRVIDDFMIQSGDPTGTSTGGKCSFEGYDVFQDEFNRNLYNFRGAVSMANGGSNTNGSQFFIVQTKSPQYANLKDADTFQTNGGAKWAAEEYEKRGGTAYLDGQFKSITSSGHTVFGQVYEGLDVVDKIASVKTDSNYKPLSDVVIKKAYLETVK